MAGYTRQDTSNNIANGNVIDADDLDAEFDALVGAFNATTGHDHDGTAAGGKPIEKVGPAQEIVVTSSAVVPKADNTIDLGTSLVEFKDLYLDGVAYIDTLTADAGTVGGANIVTTSATQTLTNKTISGGTVSGAAITGLSSLAVTGTSTLTGLATLNGGVNVTGTTAVTGNITVTGTVDGRDVAADGTKLDGIESGATADQTGAEIKALYEAEANTNAYTDAEKTKLAGIETGATADQTGAEIKALYEAEADTNAYTDAEKTKLAGIEAGATADQSAAEIKTAYESNADTNAFTDAEKTRIGLVNDTEMGILAGATVTTAELNILDGVTATASELNILDGVTASAAELNYNDITTLGTSQASKVVTADANGDVTFANSVVENIHTLSGTSVAIDPNNGTLQLHTLTGNTTYTDSLTAGESVTLMIDDGSAYTITWPTITWRNNAGSAPTLATSGYTVILLWKVSTTLYGVLVADGS